MIDWRTCMLMRVKMLDVDMFKFFLLCPLHDYYSKNKFVDISITHDIFRLFSDDIDVKSMSKGLWRFGPMDMYSVLRLRTIVLLFGCDVWACKYFKILKCNVSTIFFLKLKTGCKEYIWRKMLNRKCFCRTAHEWKTEE